MPEIILPLLLFLIIAFLPYWLVKDAFKHGQSPGKKICGLMVVNLVDSKPCSTGKSIVRNIIFMGLTSIMLFICFSLVRNFVLYSEIFALFWALVSVSVILITLSNNKGQHPGDRIAKTQVIETKDYKPERHY